MNSNANDLEYKPVPFNREKELAQAMRRPGFKAAWNSLEEKYATLSALLAARQPITAPPPPSCRSDTPSLPPAT